jgi:3-deoxy-manno-octulosonate cytidylyltransferase (CMP-KDO synthetase)
MITHTVESVRKASLVDDVIVATDDRAIADAVIKHGGRAELTSPAHLSGSDRIAEVLVGLVDNYDVVLNVQGGEPKIEAEYLDQLVRVHRSTSPDISTLATPITDEATLSNPACVKVALGKVKETSIGPVFRAL